MGVVFHDLSINIINYIVYLIHNNKKSIILFWLSLVYFNPNTKCDTTFVVAFTVLYPRLFKCLIMTNIFPYLDMDIIIFILTDILGY